MNVFTFSGRCAADAELRKTQAGESVLNFRVANDTGYGERKVTNWIDVSLWGKRGEAIADYVKKGMKLTVSGELRLEEFTKRDGTPGAKLSVRANDVDLPARSEGGGQSGGGGGNYDQSPLSGQQRGGKPAFDADKDEEYPF